MNLNRSLYDVTGDIKDINTVLTPLSEVKPIAKPSAWIYVMDSDEIRVSVKDPDSDEHELGKNEFGVPSGDDPSSTVNALRNVLEKLGVTVILT